MAKPEDCLYSKTHEWILLEGGRATIGLSDHAQKEITDVVFVDLPKAGRKVSKGESIGVVESVKAAFDFYAPLSGEVVEVNDALTDNPAMVNHSPHDDGWFIRIQVADEGEAGALMDFSKYQEFLKTDGQSHG